MLGNEMPFCENLLTHFSKSCYKYLDFKGMKSSKYETYIDTGKQHFKQFTNTHGSIYLHHAKYDKIAVILV